MKITILAIGKKHNPKIIAAIDDYTKRLGHYSSIEWSLVEGKISSSMNSDQIKQIESEILHSKINSEDTVILLDETGKQLSSIALSDRIQSYMNNATKNLVFVIGGAYGVDEILKKRANFMWSLSDLVLPHQLVRLVLIEQLYRSHTILAGEKYHHI